MRIEILDEAEADLIEGYHFYEAQETCLGSYFECGLGSLKISGNRVAISRVTACGLIKNAYFLQDFELVDAPKWTKEGSSYEIQAIAEGSETLTIDRAAWILPTNGS